MSLERRISRLEAEEAERDERWLRGLYAEVAAEFRLHPEEVYEEGERFLSLPLAEQLAEVDRLHAEMVAEGLTMDNAEDIKRTLTEHCRP
jgi:hypothetical protein